MIDEDNLSRILADHQAWLSNNGGRRANLADANLVGADLAGADLRLAELNGAYMSGSNLKRADLQGAELRWADLEGANLVMANLVGAGLDYADLRHADLSGAMLGKAYLHNANLFKANLYRADLVGANMHGANLSGNVGLCPLTAARLEILPRRGEVLGWKKCQDGAIVELVVPDGVERSNAAGRKCRSRLVRVVAVHGGEVGVSSYDGQTTYRAGEVVECDRWDPDRWVECGGGIHFYLTREEAEAYS